MPGNRIQWPSDEALREMSESMDSVQMAKSLGCCAHSVRARLRSIGVKLGLGVRCRIAWPTDAALVAWSKVMTGDQMANRLGCSPDSVNLRLRAIGAPHPRIAWPEDAVLREYYEADKLSGKAIARLIGCTSAAVYERLRKIGVTVNRELKRTSGRQPRKRKLMRKGSGYMLVYVPDHPNATCGGYVLEHRLVMEKKLGRYLTREEVVHHLDDNPANNHPDNLELFANNGLHLSVTRKGRKTNWTASGRAGQLEYRILELLDDESVQCLRPEAIQLMRRVLASLPAQTPDAPG